MMWFWLIKNEEIIFMIWSGENWMLNMIWNFFVFVLIKLLWYILVDIWFLDLVK